MGDVSQPPDDSTGLPQGDDTETSSQEPGRSLDDTQPVTGAGAYPPPLSAHPGEPATQALPEAARPAPSAPPSAKQPRGQPQGQQQGQPQGQPQQQPGYGPQGYPQPTRPYAYGYPAGQPGQSGQPPQHQGAGGSGSRFPGWVWPVVAVVALVVGLLGGVVGGVAVSSSMDDD